MTRWDRLCQWRHANDVTVDGGTANAHERVT